MQAFLERRQQGGSIAVSRSGVGVPTVEEAVGEANEQQLAAAGSSSQQNRSSRQQLPAVAARSISSSSAERA